MQNTPKTPDQMRAVLAEKASVDEEFRGRLLADARETIQEEFDVVIPRNLEIQVHEDSADTAHLVLPPSPRLGEEQLTAVAGGKPEAVYVCF